MPDSDETTPEVTTSAGETPSAGVDESLPSGEPLDARPSTASPATEAHHVEALDDPAVEDSGPDGLEAGSGTAMDPGPEAQWADTQLAGAAPAEGQPVEGQSEAAAPVEADPPTWRRFDLRTEREEAFAAAQAAVAAGECIVLPTDTVYGIGANAFSAEAVQRLLDAKHRGRDMPPPVLISDTAMLQALGTDLETYAERLAEECWPGALTLIVSMQPSLRVDLGETRGTIGLRVPDHDETRALLRRTGPLAVSSANVSGRPSSTTIDDAIEQLGNSVSVYLDAGPTPGDASSTIIDFVSATFGRIVRQGALSLDAVREVDPFVEEYVDPSARPEPTSAPVEPIGEAPGVDGDAAGAEGDAATGVDGDGATGVTDPSPATPSASTPLPAPATDASERVASDAAAAEVAEHNTLAPEGAHRLYGHPAESELATDFAGGHSGDAGNGVEGDGADRPVH